MSLVWRERQNQIFKKRMEREIDNGKGMFGEKSRKRTLGTKTIRIRAEEKRLQRESEMEGKRLEREVEEKRWEREAKLQSEKLAAQLELERLHNSKERGYNEKASKLKRKSSRQHRVKLIKRA